MQRMTRIKIAEPDIVKLFDELGRRVFTRTDLDKILAEHRANWRLAQSMTNRAFIDYLLQQTELQEVILEFPNRKETRYLWGATSAYELALSLRPGSYLTHYSAMFIHELTEQVPKTIYINQEQPKQGQGNAELLQERIDNAFRSKVRVSNEVATYGDFRICILHGMNTGKLGVIEVEGSEGERLRVTNLERTLIDAAVRPVYSGGVHEVLKAYRRAKDRLSVNKLTALLKKLKYVYPYHQVVGFYLDKAGVYKESALQLLKKFPMNFDFYLEHNMARMEFSTEWRLHYPEGF
jgi:predicted transcriptional regulator of viral defense system